MLSMIGSWYLGVFLIIAILFLILGFGKIYRLDRTVKYSFYSILAVFYYGIVIPVVLSALPKPPETDLLTRMAISYSLILIDYRLVFIFNYFVLSQVTIGASNFSEDLGLFLEVIPVIFLLIRNSMKRKKKNRYTFLGV